MAIDVGQAEAETGSSPPLSLSPQALFYPKAELMLRRKPSEPDKCANCKFYHDLGKQGDVHVVECHFDPPTIIPELSGEGQIISAWPETEAKGWCGKHKRAR